MLEEDRDQAVQGASALLRMSERRCFGFSETQIEFNT